MNTIVVKRARVIGLGFVVSASALYWALSSLDLGALGATLAAVKKLELVSCAALIAIGMFLRGWRWAVIAGQSVTVSARFARAVNLGVLGNQLLPGRLGEFVRVFALVRILPTGIGAALASAVIDRVVDIVVLMLSVWVISVRLVNEGFSGYWIAIFVGVFAPLAVVVLLLRTEGFERWLAEWSKRWLHRWAIRPEMILSDFRAIMQRLMQPRAAASLILVGALVWLVDYLTVAAAILCADISLPHEAPLLLWVSLAAGSALPSAPGYVGIYQLAAVWSLSHYGVPVHQAVAVSFVLQGLTLAVSITGSGSEVFKTLCSFGHRKT